MSRQNACSDHAPPRAPEVPIGEVLALAGNAAASAQPCAARQFFPIVYNPLRNSRRVTYFGLALLYRVTGHPEESLKVLERIFILMPKTPEIESTQIHNEAHNLYSEIKAEAESKATAH